MAFAVFDIETRVDKRLLNQVFFAGEQLSDEEAYRQFREQLTRAAGAGSSRLRCMFRFRSQSAAWATTTFCARSRVSLSTTIPRNSWCAISGPAPSSFQGCLVSFNGAASICRCWSWTRCASDLGAGVFRRTGRALAILPRRAISTLCDFLDQFRRFQAARRDGSAAQDDRNAGQDRARRLANGRFQSAGVISRRGGSTKSIATAATT